MKKAKIMLAAVVLLAGLGGAFAFKASKLNLQGLYTGALGSSICTYKFDLKTTPIQPGTQLSINTSPGTLNATAPCTTTALVTAGN